MKDEYLNSVLDPSWVWYRFEYFPILPYLYIKINKNILVYILFLSNMFNIKYAIYLFYQNKTWKLLKLIYLLKNNIYFNKIKFQK